jgi:GT2 family glycosyltransferase
MLLSIIIVSYNTKALTLACLQSIFNCPLPAVNGSLEVILYDNASTDGTVTAIARQYPQVKVVNSDSNLGFGRANNLGAKTAQGDYLFFLNSDTEVDPDTLVNFNELIHHHHPDIASCRLVNPDHSLQPQGGFLPNSLNIPLWMLNLDNLPLIRSLCHPYQLRDSKFYVHDSSLGWVAGTAMLVKKTVFDKLEGFDPKIFMYAEDLDLCWRARDQGFKIQYFCQPTIMHRGQGSGTGSSAILGEVRGILYLFNKHQPKALPFVKFWLKAGALLRVLVFDMIGKHEHSQLYRKVLHLMA